MKDPVSYTHLDVYKRQQFVNGTRPGNPQLVELAKRQVGNVGGYPYYDF